ncbi:hypothetical protein L284_13070 [Novosphingobium lindaniclasticum LE124]|uniref:Oxidoreductase n=1 Tax=Novosphingobium lindaniclasticum LE124 TaxID=1096930 RepID=T0HDE8_9SPHN|nr:hypothetical protein L284_13070 [Novosphingobium lindaniclasticum LE124]
MDIADEPNRETEAVLTELGVEVLRLTADLGRVDEIRAAFAAVQELFGCLDASVHIGGYSWRGETLQVSEELWDKVLNANLRSTFFCCQEALRIMYQQKSGAIVNMSADAAFFPMYGFALQAAGKGGIVSMTRTLALEAAEHGVRVNAVSPGIVRTAQAGFKRPESPKLQRLKHIPAEAVNHLADQTVANRYLSAEEVAQAFAFLCSDRASGISGDLHHVNGGGYFSLQY